MSSSDLAADAGQLLWVGFAGIAPEAELRERIGRGEVGAVVLFARNLVHDDGGALDLEHLRQLNRDLREAADDTPLWVAVDQEGGRVQRVRAPATRWPPMLSFDQLDDARAPSLARQVGEAMGRELAALGFNVDFAPVLDVHTNPDNPIIGDRALSTDPGKVADRGLALARGLMSAGVVPCAKHFPGHGDTHEDSHLALPRVDHPRERLEQIELAPFRRAAADDVPMIMSAHVVFAALDDKRPATLSPAVMSGLLRDDIGYRGVVVSDDLEMKAIADHFGGGEAAAQAVEAGCDAVLVCSDVAMQHEAFEALVKLGETARGRRRIGEAAARVRELKARFIGHGAPSLDVVGCAEHRRLAEELAGA